MTDGRFCLVASVDVERFDDDPAMIVVGPFWAGPLAEARRGRLERALTRKYPDRRVVVTVEWLHQDRAARDLVEHMEGEVWVSDVRAGVVPAEGAHA